MERPTLPDPFIHMREILDDHPDLGASGFRVAACSDSEFERDRRELRGELYLVHKAIRLLEAAPRTKSCQVHSCELKHTLERWLSLRNGQHEYISNGAAILACILLGITVKPVHPSLEMRTDPNANVGINRLWHRGVKTATH